jgi:hypothetical protein
LGKGTRRVQVSPIIYPDAQSIHELSPKPSCNER